MPGCSFQWGETTYMIALFPLGGYVKMVGEGPESEEQEDDPPSFKNKPVWQRMAIISAGVTMNVILAFVCFIVVFRGGGKSQNPGVVGVVEAGSPASVKRLSSGTWIRKIGDYADPYFLDLVPVVMNSGGEELELDYQLPPDNKDHRIEIKARRDKTDERPVIGISPAERAVLAPKKSFKDRDHPVLLGSAAARAAPPFEFDDEIIGCTDPEHRKGGDPKNDWTPLPEDVRDAPKGQPDFFEMSRRLQVLASERVTVRVKRKEQGASRR